MTETIVVTGLGVVCALGATRDTVAAGLRAGRRPFAPVRRFSTEGFRVDLAAEAPQLDIRERFGARVARRSSRTDQLALWAAADALSHADVSDDAKHSAALFVGASTGGMTEVEDDLARQRPPSPRACWSYPVWATARTVAQTLRLGGPQATYMTACSSSAHALGQALAALRHGELELAVAGGAEAVSRLTLAGFGSLGVLDPRGTRPFDDERAGITLGEGAAFFVLETRAHAERRRVPILAVLAGYAGSADAHHMVQPRDDGEGALAAMRAALADAGMDSAAIDYVNAHGTGTKQNDSMEARALGALFAGRSDVAVSSTKSMHGHTLGAAAAIEAAAIVLGMVHGFVPPNAGVDHAACDLGALDLVTTALPRAPRRALSPSFAFGGNNAALVLAHPETLSVPVLRRSPPRADFPVVSGGAVACAHGTTGDPATLVRWLDSVREPPSPALAGLTPSTVLGAGTVRRMDALSQAVATTAVMTLKACGASGGARLGIGLGTSFGALHPTREFLDRLFTKGATLVNPLDFPNLVHNAPAGHTAIALDARGLNLTSCQEETAADEALFAMVHALGDGTLDAALVSGGDLHCDELDAGYAHMDRLGGVAGAHHSVVASLLVERETSCTGRGHRPWARILGLGRAGLRDGVRGAVGRAVEQAALRPEWVPRIGVWLRGATDPLMRAHERLVASHPVLRNAAAINVRSVLGNAGGAGAAALLAAAALIEQRRAENVLLTSTTRQGTAYAAILGGLT